MEELIHAEWKGKPTMDGHSHMTEDQIQAILNPAPPFPGPLTGPVAQVAIQGAGGNMFVAHPVGQQ